MTRSQLPATGAALFLGTRLLAALLGTCSFPCPPAARANEHPPREEGPPKGPHGGRLLVDGEFSVEVTIFERGAPPGFRVHPAESGRPIDPAEVGLGIELHRLGGRVDTFRFTAENGYLRGDGVVEEPHSFDVVVAAEHGGRTHRWTYPSYEGRVRLTPDAVENAGIVVEAAGPATITAVVRLYGRIVPNRDRTARVIPRFPGIVTNVRADLGDAVAAGDVLATVQSNDSLQGYRVAAPIDGTVVGKNVAAGELATGNRPIFVVADLGTVWADLRVHASDSSLVQRGQRALIRTSDGSVSAVERIGYLSPFSDSETQTMLARLQLPNSEGHWRPGSFVTGDVVVEEAAVPVAVKTSALQTFRGRDVVFIREGDLFEARPLELGRRDGTNVEVLSGLAAGQRYVTENGFVIKADIGKSGATHDH